MGWSWTPPVGGLQDAVDGQVIFGGWQKQRAAQILDLLQQEFPNAGTMLEFGDTFQLLVAVILSAQSTDVQVNRVTGQLFSRYKTPRDFAEADLEELEEAIRGVGLYRTKASNIQKMAHILLEKYQGQVPDDFDELMKLPGIGRKTANVMMSVGFGQPGLGVDTHVHRVSNRLGLVEEKTPDKTELALKAIIPRRRWSQAHHLLIFTVVRPAQLAISSTKAVDCGYLGRTAVVLDNICVLKYITF